MIAKVAEATQLPLDLKLEEGRFTPVTVVDGDIGGQLLPILSKGLYTYPLHCIREYVQNAVDADATQVIIKITGNSVLIHDNGKGMNLPELLQARQFGVSTKDVQLNVGFRGIGIYSGFDLCNRLLVTTKRAGENNAYILEFDFGGMKARLAADATSGVRATPLSVLLELYSRFSQEPESRERHYTTIQLEDISDVHISQLADRAQLRKYILRNLPVDFADDFPYRDTINAALRKRVPGYKAVKIFLESDEASRETVAKPAIPDLGEPVMNPIANAKGETIAYYWACLRMPKPAENQTGDDQAKVQSRGRIPDEYADYRGFVYKVKGFTLGDNTKLQKHFKRGNSGLYWWYTGEIYVIDPAVVPNTERDDFETSPVQRALEAKVIDALKTLEKKAADYQEEGRALDKFNNGDTTLKQLKQQMGAGTYDSVGIYSTLDRLIDELRNQKSKLPDDKKQWGQKIIDECNRLKQQVRGEIDNPQPTPQKRKEAARRRNEEDTGSTSREQGTSRPAEALPVKRLSQIIQDSGYTSRQVCNSPV